MSHGERALAAILACGANAFLGRRTPMSELDDGQFCWRDTYFVWFLSARRPTAAELKKVLSGLPEHYVVGKPVEDETGRFESISVQSPADHAALEISCLA